MRRLTVAPLALLDLRDIHDYIGKDNPAAAARLLDRLEERFNMLLDLPGIGKKREELQPGIRCLAEGNYLIIYRLRNDHMVEIARVLHSKRNIQKIFKKDNR